MNILDTLNKEQIKLFTYKKINKGQTLFKENEICKQVGIIKSGNVNIISYFDDGKIVKYNSLSKNMIFGNNLIFSSDNRYKGDVIAFEDSEILLINKDNLIKLLKDNNSFLINYLQIQSDFTKTLNNRIKLLAIDNAKERFLFYLKINDNNIKYQTITQLSKDIGLTRETLSRLISMLIKENIIIRDKNIIKKII